MAFHHLAAQPVFFDLNGHFVFFDLQRVVVFLSVKIRVDAGLRFGGARLRTFAHPFQFVFQQFILALVRGGVHFFAQGFFLEVIGVTAFVSVELSAFEFNDAVAHIFEEIAVVRYHKQREAGLLEVFLKPLDHFHVEVVGGLIEDEEIRLFQQDFG